MMDEYRVCARRGVAQPGPRCRAGWGGGSCEVDKLVGSPVHMNSAASTIAANSSRISPHLALKFASACCGAHLEARKRDREREREERRRENAFNFEFNWRVRVLLRCLMCPADRVAFVSNSVVVDADCDGFILFYSYVDLMSFYFVSYVES